MEGREKEYPPTPLLSFHNEFKWKGGRWVRRRENLPLISVNCTLGVASAMCPSVHLRDAAGGAGGY